MQLQRNKMLIVLNNPVFRVASTWLWLVIGSVLLVLSILTISGVNISIYEVVINFPETTKKVGEIINRYYFGTCIEFVAVGLLPLLFTLICKDKIKIYGICWNGFVKSLLFSMLIAMLCYIGPLLTGDNPFQFNPPNLHLSFPLNFLFVMTVIIIYGPLEMFYVIWLITNTNKIFKAKKRIFSWGLIITSVMYGVANLFFSHNIILALVHISVFFMFGLIYKFTKNSIGPMIGWTLANGHILFIASLLWS